MNLYLMITGIIALVVIVVIALSIISRMKGKISIQLDNYNFSPGDTIQGKVILNLKKQVQAKALKVGLIGIYKNIQYNKDMQKKSRSGSFFEFRQPLDGEKIYPIGETNYDFQLKIPRDILANRELGGVLGSLVKSAQILSGGMSSVQWYIIANLEASGINLYKQVQINIG